MVVTVRTPVRAISSVVILPLPSDEVYPTSVVVSILITPGSPVVLVTRMILVAVVIMVIGVTIGALFRFRSSVTVSYTHLDVYKRQTLH